jgi:hypothetical protein
LALVTDLDGALLFAGIPLAIVGVVFALVFATSKKPSRDPITRAIMDDENGPSSPPPGHR